MKIIERNLQEIGESLLMTLPKEWTRSFGLKKGSKVKIAIMEQGMLSISPEFAKEETKKDVTITFDQAFERRFFKEYFGGYEIIRITFESMESHARKDIYDFLKKFMNVQIIEETKTRITVKCFRIDELSIEECLKRMFYLSTSMIDEVLQGNDKIKINEMEESLTRFYYILVMQTRRFISEGKFAEKNQISLIRALDCRMVAEKIERVGDLAKEMSITDKDLINMLGKIKETYSRSFHNFHSKNYPKSLEQLSQGKAEKKALDKIMSDAMRKNKTGIYSQAASMLLLSQFAKEISMITKD